MKYRLKTDVPYVGIQGYEITSDKYGWFCVDGAEEYNYKKPSFKPAMFPDLFELIKPKRVLVTEYEIMGDENVLNGSVSETEACWHLRNYPKDCRIEERY